MIRNVASFSFTPKTLSQFIFVQMPTGIVEEGAPVGSTAVGLRNQHTHTKNNPQKNQICPLISSPSKPASKLAICFALAASCESLFGRQKNICEPRDNLLMFFFQQMRSNSSLLAVGLLFACRERNEVFLTPEI